MTTATMVQNNSTMTARPRPSLEELVDRVIAALFPEQETAAQSVARTIHEARRMRRDSGLDAALAVFAGADIAQAETGEARWAYSEWSRLVKRRFGDGDALVYSPGTGRAAALIRRDDGALEVVAVLGMRWQPGKVVSRRSLRGLRPLAKGRA